MQGAPAYMAAGAGQVSKSVNYDVWTATFVRVRDVSLK